VVPVPGGVQPVPVPGGVQLLPCQAAWLLCFQSCVAQATAGYLDRGRASEQSADDEGREGITGHARGDGNVALAAGPRDAEQRGGVGAHAGRDPDRHDHLVTDEGGRATGGTQGAKGATAPAWATPDRLPPAAAKPAAAKAVFAVHSAHGRMGNSQLMVMRGVAVREKPARDVPSTGRHANITGSAGSGKS
jgi:hypothetical protein